MAADACRRPAWYSGGIAVIPGRGFSFHFIFEDTKLGFAPAVDVHINLSQAPVSGRGRQYTGGDDVWRQRSNGHWWPSYRCQQG